MYTTLSQRDLPLHHTKDPVARWAAQRALPRRIAGVALSKHLDLLFAPSSEILICQEG